MTTKKTKRTRKKYTRMHIIVPGTLGHELRRLAERRMTTVSSLLRGLALAELERNPEQQQKKAV